MYDRIFNVLAGLSFLGLVFIAVSVPTLLDIVYDDETPENANLRVLDGFTEGSLYIPKINQAYLSECRENREIAKEKIDSAIEIFDMVNSIEVEVEKEPELELEYVGEFYITMYAATVEQCGNDLGITASGRKVTDDPMCHTVAVDPAIIPLGTYLVIEGYDGIIFRADDTGSAINGYDIDIFTTDEQESKTFNNQSNVKVWIVKE